MAKYSSPKEIKSRIGAARYRQLMDGDGDGIEEPERFTIVAAAVDNEIDAILNQKSGTPEELLDQLVKDFNIRYQACTWVIWMLTEGKPEWLTDQGAARYERAGMRARSVIKEYAAGQLVAWNSKKNQHVKAKVNQFQPEPSHFIAPSPSNPKGPGGF